MILLGYLFGFLVVWTLPLGSVLKTAWLLYFLMLARLVFAGLFKDYWLLGLLFGTVGLCSIFRFLASS